MKLYKYVPIARMDVLKNNLIRFTQPGALNDPGEMRVQIKKLIDDNSLNNLLNKSIGKASKPDVMSKSLKENFKKDFNLNLTVEECRQLYNYILENNSEDFSSLISNVNPFMLAVFRKAESSLIKNFRTNVSEKFGVLSLSETPSDMKMWSHYASNHTGFVIVFDGKNKFFQPPSRRETDKRGLQRVKYTDKIPISEILVMDFTWEKLFFTKGMDWAHEQEWRMVKVLDQAEKILDMNNEKIYLFKIPSKAIISVILGYRMSGSDREALLNECKNDSRFELIDIKEAKLNEKEYKIEFQDLSKS